MVARHLQSQTPQGICLYVTGRAHVALACAHVHAHCGKALAVERRQRRCCASQRPENAPIQLHVARQVQGFTAPQPTEEQHLCPAVAGTDTLHTLLLQQPTAQMVQCPRCCRRCKRRSIYVRMPLHRSAHHAAPHSGIGCLYLPQAQPRELRSKDQISCVSADMAVHNLHDEHCPSNMWKRPFGAHLRGGGPGKRRGSA